MRSPGEIGGARSIAGQCGQCGVSGRGVGAEGTSECDRWPLHGQPRPELLCVAAPYSTFVPAAGRSRAWSWHGQRPGPPPRTAMTSAMMAAKTRMTIHPTPGGKNSHSLLSAILGHGIRKSRNLGRSVPIGIVGPHRSASPSGRSRTPGLCRGGFTWDGPSTWRCRMRSASGPSVATRATGLRPKAG